MGINARASLHPEWVTYHNKTISGFMTCTVTVKRRNPALTLTYDATTGLYNDVYTTTHTGLKARIQPFGINLDFENGNDPTARRLVLVQFAQKNLGIVTDDVVIITAATTSTDLMKYQLDVRGGLPSSLEWGTNLVTEANLKVA